METELVQTLKSVTESINALAQPRFIDWLAIAVSFISVVLSGVAIWFAVHVPKKIANRQDKIALFDKRYDCFQFFQCCIHLYFCVTNEHTLEELKCYLQFMLKKQQIGNIDEKQLDKQLARYEYVLHQMQFLFPGIEEKHTEDIYKALAQLLVAVTQNEKIEEMECNFATKMGTFINEYGQTIFGAMSIQED